MIEKVVWGGWPNCYRVSNGEADPFRPSSEFPAELYQYFLTNRERDRDRGRPADIREIAEDYHQRE